MTDSFSTLSENQTYASQDEILIRETGVQDNDTLQDVILSAYMEYRLDLPEEGWIDYKHNIAEAVYHSPIEKRIVAELNGEIVGSVFLYRSGLDAYGNEDLHINNPVIRLLAVKPESRGLGIGKKLIQYCINLARQKGADKIHLHTSDMMAHAILIYEKLGFERAYDKEFEKGEILVKSYQYYL